jgi:hypothetical protein
VVDQSSVAQLGVGLLPLLRHRGEHGSVVRNGVSLDEARRERDRLLVRGLVQGRRTLRGLYELIERGQLVARTEQEVVREPFPCLRVREDKGQTFLVAPRVGRIVVATGA